jgi:hypothetical protein
VEAASHNRRRPLGCYYYGLQFSYQCLIGEQLPTYKMISIVLFVVCTALVVGFNLCWRYLWKKLPFLGRWLFPDLNGTWKGSLQTTWKDAAGVTPGPIETTIWIKQSLMTISVRQKTKESISYSTRMLAERDSESGVVRLWFSYDNKPDAAVSYRSEQHEGVCGLEQDPSVDKNRLTGQYYTSRNTNGDIQVKRAPQ